MAVLPWYVGLFADDDGAVVSSIGALRVARLIKITRADPGTVVFVRALRRSKGALITSFTMIGILVLLSAATLNSLELLGADPDSNMFAHPGQEYVNPRLGSSVFYAVRTISSSSSSLFALN